MNDFKLLQKQAEYYRKAYPAGTRIVLLHMRNDPRPVADNMKGTVKVVDDIGTLHCDFDDGRSLGIVPGEDTFRKLTTEELEEEQISVSSEDHDMRM